MFPIRDNIRSRSFPIMNWALIIANVLVFLFELSLSSGSGERLIRVFGLTPANIVANNPLTWYTIFSSMFLHSGWLHILSNLWILYIFGDNVEDRLGSFRYLIFYLLSGTTAALVQILSDPASQVPVIGASGAIAGVLGAYIVLFPKSRVLSIIPVFILPWLVEIPAVIYLGFWFITQLFSGLLSLSSVSAAQGIAVWAHVGGFLFGVAFYRFFVHRKPDRWYPDQYYPW